MRRVSPWEVDQVGGFGGLSELGGTWSPARARDSRFHSTWHTFGLQIGAHFVDFASERTLGIFRRVD